MKSLSFLLALVYVNVMPGFWHAWDSTKGQPASVRVAAFKEAVIYPNLGAFINSEFARNLGSDDEIASYLDSLEPRIGELRALSDRASAELPGDIARIQVELPGLSLGDISVYLMPSFHHFNGQIHDLGKGIGVFLGVDGLLDFDGPDVNISVTIAHELFHVYQFETHPGYHTGDALLWQAVWGEGSAAYASQYLAARATKEQALGEQLAKLSPAQTKALACYVQSHWNSQRDDDIDSLLDAGAHADGLPPRGGYLIGYLAAADFAKTHTIAQIGSEPLAQVEPSLEASVNRLCAGA